MSLITKVILKGDGCECEIELNMVRQETSTIDPTIKFTKTSTIRRLCTQHELDLRRKVFKDIKNTNTISKNDRKGLEDMQNYLNDLSNEIPNN